jgi:hypothetical protein
LSRQCIFNPVKNALGKATRFRVCRILPSHTFALSVPPRIAQIL